jgi:hypothetical protein
MLLPRLPALAETGWAAQANTPGGQERGNENSD